MVQKQPFHFSFWLLFRAHDVPLRFLFLSYSFSRAFFSDSKQKKETGKAGYTHINECINRQTHTHTVLTNTHTHTRFSNTHTHTHTHGSHTHTYTHKHTHTRFSHTPTDTHGSHTHPHTHGSHTPTHTHTRFPHTPIHTRADLTISLLLPWQVSWRPCAWTS